MAGIFPIIFYHSVYLGRRHLQELGILISLRVFLLVRFSLFFAPFAQLEGSNVLQSEGCYVHLSVKG